MRHLALLASCLLLLAAPATGQESLALRETLACTGRVVLLGDLLAAGSAGALDARRVAQSPAPGETALLDRERLARQLADWGWTGRLSGPAQVKLHTPGVVVALAPLANAVRAELTARLDSLGLRLSGEVEGWPAELVCAAPRLQWRLALPDGQPRANGSARLTLTDAVGFEQVLELAFPCARPLRVGVVTAPLPRGARLGEWREEERDAFHISGEPLPLAALPGALISEPLRAGEVVTRRNARPAPLVKAGREVEVRLERGGVTVSLRGIAREDGALGELVGVKHLDGQVQRRYRVAGPGLVVPSYLSQPGGSS
ncbi:flagellar basal body P-ring formation protein FlgA [bacterium]|nr:flagellar basal body P-ring formation protein FlgA [bacterium]